MRALAIVLVLVLAAGLAPVRARAAETPKVESILEAAAYVLPVGCAALTGTFNAAYLAYEEGAPRRWRTAAYVCGGLSIGVGTYVLIDDAGASTRGTVLGILPIVVGAGAVLTAWFVGAPDDVVGDMSRVTPWVAEGGGGVVWSGRF